jgi:hypothetical protein
VSWSGHGAQFFSSLVTSGTVVDFQKHPSTIELAPDKFSGFM